MLPQTNSMKVLVTGSNGFIGKNLVLKLGEFDEFSVVLFTRDMAVSLLPSLVGGADAVVHLAGENRPENIDDFVSGNVGVTEAVCAAVRDCGRKIPVIFTSSSQASLENSYGSSKLEAEMIVEKLHADIANNCVIYRLPGVFGKWCRPNYNSVVATFCYNLARDLPVRIDDPNALLTLVYVDDVIEDILSVLRGVSKGLDRRDIAPVYSVTLEELAAQIERFKVSRETLVSEAVGTGFIRALYSTYVSYLPMDKFTYQLPCHADERGVFVEMLKTEDSGQFSFFTAHPGVTRGGHYHHSKTEKFLVLNGRARFGFRSLDTDETFEVIVDQSVPTVVETIPGWAHDIKNIGSNDLIVMLWVNEIFDPRFPDTITSKV